MINLLMLIGNGWRLIWKMAIVIVMAIGLGALLSELRDLLKIQSRRLVSEQRVEMSLEPERHTSLDNLRFPIRPILASKTTIGKKMGELLGVRFFVLDNEIESFFETSIERLQNRFIRIRADRNKQAVLRKAHRFSWFKGLQLIPWLD